MTSRTKQEDVQISILAWQKQCIDSKVLSKFEKKHLEPIVTSNPIYFNERLDIGPNFTLVHTLLESEKAWDDINLSSMSLKTRALKERTSG